jgi:predicted RNA-binding Zn-ribbon protein involved in translation (DUF1610 family)
MEDIVVVKAGIEATVYYRHTCSQCDAVLDIKGTVTEFKCPNCGKDEICTKNPESLVKKYKSDNLLPSPVLKTNEKETKKLKKKFSLQI